MVLEITCRCGVQCNHLNAVITGTNLKCPLPMAWTLQKEGMHSIKEKAAENRLNELVNDPPEEAYLRDNFIDKHLARVHRP